jgi:hypothetical protein
MGPESHGEFQARDQGQEADNFPGNFSEHPPTSQLLLHAYDIHRQNVRANAYRTALLDSGSVNAMPLLASETSR